jgi:tetratricopeptide (TPR) repeat protein
MRTARLALIAAATLAAAGAAWWFLAGRAGSAPAPPSFAGSASCASCHAPEHAAWAKSQHALAMQEAGEATVLGRFDGSTFGEGGTASRFFRRDGRFLMYAQGPDGRPAEFEAKYAFGVYPLQQYLVPLPGGRLQAFNIAWDARPAAQGGQRWFDLYAGQDLQPGDPLHWTGIDQNWNYQCADCHSTNLRKNYDATTKTYATTWSEISVGCEACHGPASNHLAWAGTPPGWRSLDETRGLAVTLDERRGVEWRADASSTATRSAPRTSSREIDTCARCHARRGQYTDAVRAGDPWLDAFRPALLEAGLYHADGQQRDEVYTWGSFVQSRMHTAGVTCADCHEPHGQQLRAPGNAVCAQCHAPAAFDAPAHHRHDPGSTGAACVACHMPATTYMVVDPRHDHSLRIPRPDLSVTLGTPNACGSCHADRGAQWAADAVAAWYPQRKPGFQSFAAAFAAAEAGDPAATGALAALIGDAQQPAIVRASAVARAARLRVPEVVGPLTSALADGDALVRATAAEAVGETEPALRAERLPPLLRDPARGVRMAAARSLAGEAEARLVGAEHAAFAAALDEWTAAQRFTADRPESLLNIGSMQLARGDAPAATGVFREALALDPTFVQAAVNLAEARRGSGDEAGAEQTLRAALARDPGAAAAHHALGLSLVRQGRTAEALGELARAASLAPGEPRFAYVYAVALHDTGREQDAVTTLRAALRRHPHDRDLAQALAAYAGG